MDTDTYIKEENQQMKADKNRIKLLKDLPVEEKITKFAGISTAYLEGGAGTPLVLLHGPGESAVWWLRTLPELVKNFKVIAPDLPGHGSSCLPEGKFENDVILNWLDDLVKKTCLEPPVILGHIVGGAIAARYAIANPQKLKHLILVDSLGLGSFRPAPMFAFELIRFMINPTEKSYLKFLPHCLYDIKKVEEGMGENWQPFLDYNLTCAQSPVSKAAVKALMGKMTAKIPEKELENLNIPVTLIWGRHDKANKLKVATKASQKFNWPLNIIEECRDDPKIEQPLQFVNIIRTSFHKPYEMS